MSDKLKHWTEAQRRLWDSLSTNLPTFQPPQGLEGWRETYLRNLEAWEQSVQQTLQMQADWVREWSGRLSQDYGHSSMGEWSRQVEDVMQHWLDTQTQLWNNWFAMLRSSGEVRPQINPPRQPEEASPKVQHPGPVAETPAAALPTAEKSPAAAPAKKAAAKESPPAAPKKAPARKGTTKKEAVSEPPAPKAETEAPAPTTQGAAQAEPAPAEPVTNQPKPRRTTTRKTPSNTGSRSTTDRAKTTRTQSKTKAKAPAPEERPNPAQPGTPESARLGPTPEAQTEPVVSTPQSPDKAPEDKAADQDQQNQG